MKEQTAPIKNLLPSLDIDITFQTKHWDECDFDVTASIETAICRALHAIGFKRNGAEVSVVLADNNFVQDLNKNYRDKDKPTNVLSFPQDEEMLLGDIIVAYETVADECITQEKSFHDHFMHLITHGTLHLMGYDHIKDNEAEEMEALEIKILGELGIKNPYEKIDFMS